MKITKDHAGPVEENRLLSFGVVEVETSPAPLRERGLCSRIRFVKKSINVDG
ncbi:MAG: hypothetical protein AB7F20_03620 [Geoalkalibacter sp.]|uniref:hypothetical protein n=1 Tax=Geoalkalibacter sp. TaxID=3041440 RepID=UPI003D0B0A4E